MQLKSRVDRFDFRKIAEKPKKKSWVRRSLTGIFITVAAVAGFVGLNSQVAQTQMRQPTAVTETVSQPAVVTQPVQVEQQAAQPVDTVPYVSARAGAEQSQRGLMPGELALAKLFGSDFGLDNNVRLHFFDTQKDNAVSGTSGNNDIEFYGKKNASMDYSKDVAFNFGSFMHELTGLWQNRQGDAWLHGTTPGFEYPLSTRFTFDNYGPSQQRAMIEDYALRFLHPDRQSYWLPSVYGGDKSDTDPILIKIVEDKFPAMKAARLAHADVVDRKLVDGERVLLYGLFDGQLDTSGMRTIQHPENMRDRVGSVASSSTTTTDYWGVKESSADYSADLDAERFGTFVHENTHVWQNQTNHKYTLVIDDKDPDKYSYPLDAKYDFTRYTVEQQAAIMEDYARYFLHPSHYAPYMSKVYSSPVEFEQKLPLLKKVVEEQFPGAKVYREAYEAKQAQKQPVATLELPTTVIRISSSGPG